MYWLICSGAGDFISDFNTRNTKKIIIISLVKCDEIHSDEIYNGDTCTNAIPSVRKLKTLQ